MRVLHLAHTHPSLGSTGGTELYVQALAEARGDPVFTRDHGQGLRREERLWLAGSPAPTDFRASWSQPALGAALRRVMEQERADLIHVHHLAHLDLGPPPGPYLVTLHDYHLACARGQLVDAAGALCEGPSPAACARCLAPQLRLPRRLSSLGGALGRLGLRDLAGRALGAAPPSPEMQRRVAERNASAASVLRGARRVLSPSTTLARRFEALGLAQGVQVQDLPLLGAMGRREPRPGPTRFLFVGALIPTKGPLELLQAFAEAGDGSLRLYGPKVPYFGDLAYAEEVLRAAERTPGASYGGVFRPSERAEVFADADVLVVPSSWPENSPLVVREALATGLHVIATDHGGVRELDPEASTVPPGDRAALVAALVAAGQAPLPPRPRRTWPMEQHLEELEAHYRAALG